jgi:Tfp pilus assembly protein PilF
MAGAVRSHNGIAVSNPILGVVICLAAITWLVFGQTLRHSFVNYDDQIYIYENPHVASGLSPGAVKWAFTHTVGNNWHPLTVLSHMLDCQWYGLKASGHHFTNVILHMTAVILLFLVLREMTGLVWRSAFVAALFAIHPLHVESVAWIAERKDVLSAMFFMLTLGAYLRYVRGPSLIRYFVIIVLFALGLMAKPMLVTLPFVLLLLDFWPLNRFAALPLADSNGSTSRRPWAPWRMVLEKIPLLLLSAASSVATFLAQHEILTPLRKLTLAQRVENAIIAPVIYMWQMVWPFRLPIFYAHPTNTSVDRDFTLSVALLLAISGGALIWKRKRPYCFIGWLWYLGMLLPVIGLVQVGNQQTHADRYTYLPQIGLYLAITWLVADLSLPWRHRGIILGVATAIVLLPLSLQAWTQTSYWRDSRTLWAHALALNPNSDDAHNGLCELFAKEGHLDLAIQEGEKALRIGPDRSDVHYNLATVFLNKGQLNEAFVHFRKALELNPRWPRANFGIAKIQMEQGNTEQARVSYQRELQIQPNDANSYNDLGVIFSRQGKVQEAMAQWQAALEREPNHPSAQYNLAWLLATSPDDSVRSGTKAVELAERAQQLSRGADPRNFRLLAAAYAESGRFSEAIDVARKGRQAAVAQKNMALAYALEGDIALYQENFPLRDVRRFNH